MKALKGVCLPYRFAARGGGGFWSTGLRHSPGLVTTRRSTVNDTEWSVVEHLVRIRWLTSTV